MNIKDFRETYKITQIELARLIGVSTLTIQLWERGATTPSEENMKKLNSTIAKIEKGEV